MDFLKRLLFKRDLGLSVEETLPFWTIFVLILSFDITLTVLFAILIIAGDWVRNGNPILCAQPHLYEALKTLYSDYIPA